MAGNEPSSAEGVLAPIPPVSPVVEQGLVIGNEQAGLTKDSDEVSQSIGGIAAGRVSLKAELDAKIVELNEAYEEDLAKLDAEETGLRADALRLKSEKEATEARLARLGGKLRTTAESSDLRGDKLAYAAFATGDLSNEGLHRLAEIDDAVRENGGEAFLLAQRGLVTFGRIRKDNEGLLISTAKDTRPKQRRSAEPIKRVHLPVAPGSDGEPQFGWVSTNFDGYRDDDYQMYDPVMGRGSDEDEDELVTHLSSQMSNFNAGKGDVYIPAPTKLALPPAEEAAGLDPESDNYLVTGDEAVTELHRFIGARLGKIASDMENEQAFSAFGNASIVALGLGIFDARRIPNLAEILAR